MLCSVCDRTFDSERTIEEHNNEHRSTTGLVGVVSLFSCDRCDFDKETSEGLKEHLGLNIHNIKEKSSIITQDFKLHEDKSTQFEDAPIEKKIFYCHKCEYSAYDEGQVEEHGIKLHGIIKCDRCEYSAEDSEETQDEAYRKNYIYL